MAKKNIDDGRVDFYVPLNRDSSDDEGIVLSHNGKTIQIKRGEHVRIPKAFAATYGNAEREKDKAFLRANARAYKE